MEFDMAGNGEMTEIERIEDENDSDAPQINRRQMMMEKSKVSSDLAQKMVVKIEKFCPFVCSIS
jgi:hypothetical protein